MKYSFLFILSFSAVLLFTAGCSQGPAPEKIVKIINSEYTSVIEPILKKSVVLKAAASHLNEGDLSIEVVKTGDGNYLKLNDVKSGTVLYQSQKFGPNRVQVFLPVTLLRSVLLKKGNQELISNLEKAFNDADSKDDKKDCAFALALMGKNALETLIRLADSQPDIASDAFGYYEPVEGEGELLIEIFQKSNKNWRITAAMAKYLEKDPAYVNRLFAIAPKERRTMFLKNSRVIIHTGSGDDDINPFIKGHLNEETVENICKNFQSITELQLLLNTAKDDKSKLALMVKIIDSQTGKMPEHIKRAVFENLQLDDLLMSNLEAFENKKTSVLTARSYSAITEMLKQSDAVDLYNRISSFLGKDITSAYAYKLMLNYCKIRAWFELKDFISNKENKERFPELFAQIQEELK